MTSLNQTLLACQSQDAAIRTQAEQSLASYEQSNYAEFALALATELSTETNDVTARHLAGLHFKNLLVAKDAALQHAKHAKWTTIPAPQRANIKGLLLLSLLSEQTQARDVAAQATAEVAAIELPACEWPELVPELKLRVMQDGSHSDKIRISTLKCLGYTCERVANMDSMPDLNATTTDDLLTTIVHGIRPDRPDDVRLAAAEALRNSLHFTTKNFENQAERDEIMKTICEGTQSASVPVRRTSYECIAQIAYRYYDKLESYMQTIFKLTHATIQNDEEEVALQAIEFWSTLCEEEMDIILDQSDDRNCVRYVQAVTPLLVPLLLETLMKQDENADADDVVWNLSMAAATCLGLIANTVSDAIVQTVMPFVEQNIQSEEWRKKEAATMAFSSILDGPSVEIMAPFVNKSIPVLLSALSHKHVMIKDTTAWTIGRICELHVRAIPQETFPTLVNGLAEKLLTERPQVSSQACFALHNLAAAFESDNAAETSGSNALSNYMQYLLSTLLQVADREDASESNLRVAAFEAVSVLIQHSAPDCKPLLLQLLPVIIQKLQLSFTISVLTNDDKEQKEAMQGLLCGLIQVLVYKLEKVDIMPQADTIMQNLLLVLQIKNATCHEEAFSAISSVCTQVEGDFEKYLSALAEYLKAGLENFQSYQVCTIAVGLVGDIARAVENKILPYCNDIMTAFVQALQDEIVHRSVKPPILSCFGDIALALGQAYVPYMQVSLMMLMQASQTQAAEDDEEMIDYVNQLREGILEAYTGIIQGLKDGGSVDSIASYILAIMQFLEVCDRPENQDHYVLGKAAGLIGDIANAFGPSLKEHLNKQYIQDILNVAYQNGDDSTKSTCTWAKEQVQVAIQS